MCSSTPPMDGRKKSLSINTHSLRRVPLAMSSSSSRATRGDDDGSGSGSFARVELLYVLGREAPNHDVHGAAERTK